MLLQDMETYLNAQGPFSQDGTAYKVYIGSLPDSDSTAIALRELPGKEAIRAMGASLSAPVRERPLVQVWVRGPQRDYVNARAMAEQIHLLLDGLNTTLSARLYAVRALAPPSPDRQDRNARWMIVTTYMVEKERG